MKTKFAIGCLIQWYECDIIGEYVDSLKDAINEYDGEVIVNFTIVANQDLEKCVSEEQHSKCINKIKNRLTENGFEVLPSWQKRDGITISGNLITIADYRREFNVKYCDLVDVLVWGETDMLVPKQMFVALDNLHQNVDTPKYLATFGICKMWDESWKALEHTEFTDKPFIEDDVKNWWSLRYTMNKDEMNSFNDKVDVMDVSLIAPHKFNGCGLVISSEVIKSGVNIPKSVFFVHEDTAFMLMTNKVLGNIPQYHFKNILLVHNRKHPEKRVHVQGEQGIKKTDTGALRRVHDWYAHANKMCEQNCYNLFNPNYKPYTWKDVFKELNK